MIKKSILLCSSALLMLTGSYAQNSVTTGGLKYTLMEEITGQWCGFCPDGKPRRAARPNPAALSQRGTVQRATARRPTVPGRQLRAGRG